MFNATVLADSISPTGHRLTTMLWEFPRVILAEVNTHRMLSRNTASSRAIPIERMIQMVDEDPFIPEFRKNKKGMQAGDGLTGDERVDARNHWSLHRYEAILTARKLSELGVHKQYANRLLEPWMFVKMIVSATDWDNVWKLRCHEDAEPSFNKIACMARDAIGASVPTPIGTNDWHLPLVDDTDIEAVLKQSAGLADTFETLKKISVGRCARVSYLTHDGKRDHAADIELHDRLKESGHWSPFEHVATPMEGRHGNFTGWKQARKFYPGESGVAG